MHNTLKVRFTKQNQQQNKWLWLWWVCRETMRFWQFVLSAMTPTGSLWAEPPLEADVPSTGSNKRRWSIYPSFAGRKFQTFSPPKFFWKFENLSGFNEAELSTTDCSLAIFIFGLHKHMLLQILFDHSEQSMYTWQAYFHDILSVK